MVPVGLLLRNRYRKLYSALGDAAKTRGRLLGQRRAGRVRARLWLKLAQQLSWLDLAKVSFRARRTLYFAYFSCILGVVGTLVLAPISVDAAGICGLAGVSTGVIGVWLEINAVKRSNLEIKIVQSDDDLSDLVPEQSLVRHRGSVALYDPAINAMLAADSRCYRRQFEGLAGRAEPVERPPDEAPLVAVAWEREMRPLSHKIPDEYRLQLLLHLYKSSRNRPFNNLVVGQTSSLRRSLAQPDVPIRFAPSQYFDLLRSNYLVGFDVFHRGTSERLLEGRHLVTDDRGRLEPLEDSFLSNAVGVSTLAFDSDRRLIIVVQADDALSSQGLYAPSGSGSLEPVDLTVPERDGIVPLAAVIAAGMNRELCEEANIRSSDIAWSELTGYFRWISKGAKPEYVGVTVLRKRTSELSARVRWVERRYVDRILVGLLVDFDRLAREPQDPTAALEAKYRPLCSVPLAIGLRALGERLQDRAFAAEFLPAARVREEPGSAL